MNPQEHKQILLVEDNPDLRSATEDLLTTLGYRVTCAPDMASALEFVRRESPDLVLVNAYPAHGSGIDTLDAIRTEAPSLPALLMSGFGDDLELRQRLSSGTIGFLAIPFSPQTLKAKIEEAFETMPEVNGVVSIRQQTPVQHRAVVHTFTRSRRLLAAAVMVFAAGVVFQLADRAPRLPNPDLSEIRRGHTIELLEPTGVLDEIPTRLTWREAPGSARYRVVLSTVDDTTLWQIETRETSITLPAQVATRLHRAVSYFWQVEGLAENFSQTGRSTLIAFRFGVPEPISTGE